MAKKIAISNQKGGVGKTTSAVNISTALAAIGKKTLLIDMDPQSNATTAFGINGGKQIGIYNALIEKIPLKEIFRKTLVPELQIATSSINLIGAEVELVNLPNREFVLKNLIESIENQFDFIVIDCPPSMGLLTLNALIASDYAIIPLQCEYYALEGLSYLMQSIEKIKINFKTNLEILGIILTMYDKRSSLSIHIANDVRNHLKKIVFENVIPRNVKMAQAPSYGKPGLIYDIKASASLAYLEVTKEIINKLKDK
jgi:chromosome partitioning protein